MAQDHAGDTGIRGGAGGDHRRRLRADPREPSLAVTASWVGDADRDGDAKPDALRPDA
jgi:hypothetical protein